MKLYGGGLGYTSLQFRFLLHSYIIYYHNGAKMGRIKRHPHNVDAFYY